MTDSPTVRRTVVIPDKDPAGFHLRPLQVFVALASKYKSKIEVERDAVRVDGKSIMHMLALGGHPGYELILEAEGNDAAEAIDELARYIESGFETDDTTCQNPAQ